MQEGDPKSVQLHADELLLGRKGTHPGGDGARGNFQRVSQPELLQVLQEPYDVGRGEWVRRGDQGVTGFTEIAPLAGQGEAVLDQFCIDMDRALATQVFLTGPVEHAGEEAENPQTEGPALEVGVLRAPPVQDLLHDGSQVAGASIEEGDVYDRLAIGGRFDQGPHFGCRVEDDALSPLAQLSRVLVVGHLMEGEAIHGVESVFEIGVGGQDGIETR